MMFYYLHKLSSPAGFYRIADKILPICAWLSAVAFAVGLVWGLFVAPPDYQQGDAYRIIFVHVPAAWMSLLVYTIMAGLAAGGVIWRFKLSEVLTAAAAPIGASFTFLALASGSIWGKPMWGAWWVWDARLTSELILLFLYLGFIALQSSSDDKRTAWSAGAVLLLVGFVNIPVIHFSVEWWNTLHQPATLSKFGAPSMPAEMLWPLLIMMLAFLFFFLTVLLLRAQSILLARGGTWVEQMAAEK